VHVVDDSVEIDPADDGIEVDPYHDCIQVDSLGDRINVQATDDYVQIHEDSAVHSGEAGACPPDRWARPPGRSYASPTRPRWRGIGALFSPPALEHRSPLCPHDRTDRD
jgi:hypothetical protein